MNEKVKKEMIKKNSMKNRNDYGISNLILVE